MLPPHPWTLDHFRETRHCQYSYTVDVIYSEDSKFKVVRAPVKSGKRSFPEIASLLRPTCVHMFVSALNRKADKSQHDELKKYGILVYLTHRKKTADSCVDMVLDKVNAGKEVHIHLDECDYGCKQNQVLSTVYFRLKDEKMVKFILYSATIDVVRRNFLNDKIPGFVVLSPFVPAAAYYGVNEYLEEKKVVQSTSFVNFHDGQMTLTEQGKECLGKLMTDTYNQLKKQHIGVLRLSGKQGKIQDFRAFKNHVYVVESFAREYIKNNVARDENYEEKLSTGIKVVFVSSTDTTIKWDDSDYWSSTVAATDVPVLIVICQVAGRSTEWKCHPFLSWFHTCRSDKTNVSTQIQDQERVVYYDTDYNKGTDITLYGNESCALYSASRITATEMIILTKKKLALTLNGRCLNSSQVVMKTPAVYDAWEDIPEDVVLDLELKKEDFIDDRLRLKTRMNYTKQKKNMALHYIVEVPDWSGEDEGFYMTDVRGSMNNFLYWCYRRNQGYSVTSSKVRKPVWHRSDLLKSLSTGMNKSHPLRINVFYEDGETDPEKYKFMVREVASLEPALFKNDSMYNFSN